jgi:hypothetical protein
MWTRLGVMTATAAVVATTLGCTQPASGPSVVVEDKVYAVTPAAVNVTAGIMTGQLTEMKVMERIEKDSGKVVYPAKLTGKLVLKNSSVDQTVRLIGGKIQFMDAQGQAIKVEEKRIEPTVKFSTYGAAERLDPGQETTQIVDVDFPAEALKVKKLKEIRLDLVYLPSSYREETVKLPVSISGQ